MKYITVILLFFMCSVSAQLSMDYVIGSSTITIIEFNTELGAKLVQKRFDMAVIGKDINEVTENCRYEKNVIKRNYLNLGNSRRVVRLALKDYCYDNYFIEIEEGDQEEYFKLLGIKIYCLPKRLRKELLTFEIERL